MIRRNLAHIFFHVAVVALSAAVALSFPVTIRFVAGKVLAYWALIENEKLCRSAAEISSAAALIIVMNSLVRSWMLRRYAGMAQDAGLMSVARSNAFLAAWRRKKVKEKLGFGRNIMIIGATGYRTFTEPTGQLYGVVRNCREARIMLLDPLGAGVVSRARSMADPEITPDTLRDQLVCSIAYLKELRASQKNIRLKLYPDVPLLKLCILGDHLCLQHYPTGLNVRRTQEYLLRHENSDNLFSLFYAYFADRWLDPDIPEYDLDADMLVYRDRAGQELRREPVEFLQLSRRVDQETAAPAAGR